MSRLTLTLAAVSLFVGRVALPCGGGFGQDLEIGPEQTIVIAHDGTTETYVFNPAFCGTATDFGLILPVPAALSSNPKLADGALVDAVKAVSAPTAVRECSSSDTGCLGASDKSGAEPGLGGRNIAQGVDVIDSGQVGIFDWSLLQADTPAAFTDWLEANGYPYAAAAVPHFEFYVSQVWYFVAFKVTAGDEAPPPGSRLCGTLGPLVLQFSATNPVVPARIASVNQSETYGPNIWRIFAIAGTQQDLVAGSEYGKDLYFSGAITAEALSDYPALASYATAGDRLTGLTIYFPAGGVVDDIYLQDAPSPRDHRETVYVYEDCGCAAASGRVLPSLLVAAVAAGFVRLRRRRLAG
jgi:hypothetical protein